MANIKFFLLLFLLGYAFGSCDFRTEQNLPSYEKENICERPDITRLGKVPDFVCDSYLDLTCSADDQVIQPLPETRNDTVSEGCNEIPDVFLGGFKIPTEEIHGIIFIGPPMLDTTNQERGDILFPVTHFIHTSA